ncbi:hypothetical protein ACWGHM_31925 [Streptomyces sp. NPDC054904]|uniref:hypothetical protein n=1 Tax=Streptomyces sp. NPDC090054 TaxID=3365933 RepID=UPI00383005D5
MTRALNHTLDNEEIDNLPASFRTGFKSLLRKSAAATEEFGHASPTDAQRLTNLIDDAKGELDRVQQHE